jgi:hypothetical protein
MESSSKGVGVASRSVVLGVTLRGGESFSFVAPKTLRPRRWKSWVMDQLPYGTEFFGCRWFVNGEER